MSLDETPEEELEDRRGLSLIEYGCVERFKSRCPRLHHDAVVFSLGRTPRFDVDEIKVAVSYASVQSGVASLIPVLHGVVTPMRLLFHCGFFMGHFSLRTRDPLIPS